MITITSGDTTPLSLTAATGGTAFDLTGATFQTLIKGVAGVRTIPNGQHAIVSAAAGTFTVSLTAADYEAIGTGSGKDIVVTVTQGASVTHFHLTAGLTILSAKPGR
jgi:hypothetical protein